LLAVIQRVGDEIGGRDQARLEEEDWEAVNLPAVIREGGATAAEILLIG
jgi:hypothetical protein